MHNSFLQRRGTATLFPFFFLFFFFFFFFFFYLRFLTFLRAVLYFITSRYSIRLPTQSQGLKLCRDTNGIKLFSRHPFFCPFLEEVAHFLLWKASWQCGTGGFTRRGKKGNQEGAYLTNHWDSEDGA